MTFTSEHVYEEASPETIAAWSEAIADFDGNCNDWWLMTEEYPQTRIIAECPSESYAGYSHFNREMLELFQKYQSKD